MQLVSTEYFEIPLLKAGKCCFPYYEALTEHPLRVSRLV